MKKTLIAMSGGVDSSVAAFLMKENGYNCVGITMKLFENEEVGICKEKTCCSLDDVNDARSIANKLNIPYYVLNFTANFKKEVIERFVEAYQNGYTPNPCIDCNRYIKFEKLFLRAKQLELDYVVTGHYSRIEYDTKSGRYLLKKAVDETKDQSYVLYFMTQNQLAHTIFPLGDLLKTQVRKIALMNNFTNAKKHDSQDICFVNDGYAKFIEKYSNKAYPIGNFTDELGNVLGKHKGIIRYTIGQRKGLGLAFQKPMYVCSKCTENNTIILGEENSLYTDSLMAKDINLISCEKIEQPIRAKAKIRYKQEEQWATVNQIDYNTLHIKFDNPQRAIAKGQAVVLYDGDVVIGGGTIF
jgi:tRNA-specific 2-thiouridylase